MTNTFKVGDRVISNARGATRGLEGTIVCQPEDVMPGVDFGPEFEGHELDGSVKSRTGWWVDAKDLQHVTPAPAADSPALPASAEPATAESLNAFFGLCHERSNAAGWWNDPETGEDLLSNPTYAPFVVATKILLAVSELTEGMEGLRKDAKDDKLPNRSMLEVELADAVIRVGDLAGKLGLDVGGAIAEKMQFNSSRPDHKTDNRRKPGGKKF